MLRGLRKASSGWVGKAIMAVVVGFLIISFVIWGIGDIFRGGGRQTVATIGKVEISGDQFRQTFNDRLQQISRQAGKPITPAQAQLFGFDQQMLGQMIAESALDQTAASLKLGVSDAEVSKRIMADPTFRGLSGSFDQQRFQDAIRQAGFTEQRYVAEQRRIALRRQLASAIAADINVPTAETEAANRFQNEQRSADYVTLTRAAAGEIAPPAQDVLEKYFADRKVAFRAPEYRKLSVLTLSGDEIAKTLKISDDDARKIYEQRKTQYSTPEKRDLQQIVFPNEEDAKAAKDKLAAGTTFEQIAAERNLKPSDISLNGVAKASIIDKDVAEAAFTLKEGEISTPVKGRFGVALVRVTKIEPGRVSTFDEVSAEIKAGMAADEARAKVSSLRDKVEDELAAGSRLDEIANKVGVPVRTIDAVDRSGRGPDGNPVADLPATEILNGAFSSDVGVENDPIQIPGGFVWYQVAGITAPRDRTLDEVRPRVEARWRDDEIASRLKTKADELVEKIKGGTALAQLASENSLKVEAVTDIKRDAADPLPPVAVAEIFKTAKDAAGTSEGKDPIERIVFRVTAVSTPAFDAASPGAKTITDNLRNSISDELLAQYVARIQSDLGTTVNRAALNQALNGGSAPGN